VADDHDFANQLAAGPGTNRRNANRAMAEVAATVVRRAPAGMIQAIVRTGALEALPVPPDSSARVKIALRRAG
jgi:hypothetical protein